MAGVNKEIWIAEILEKFYPDSSFLTQVRDMTAFVEYNTINLAEAGVDPNVLVNNTTYPVPFAPRVDNPIALPLDTYDTEGTVVRNVEEIESAYDKMASVASGHRNALRSKTAERAAHAYAPDSDDTFTPVLPSTGDTSGEIKKLTLDDVFDLNHRFDLEDQPEDRVLILHPTHYLHLKQEDAKLFKSFVENRRQGFDLLGFKTYIYSRTPRFNRSTGIKVPFGAASGGTDTISSVAFIGSEVMKCDGTVEMFARLKDPEQKGDIINFQKRFLALPLRLKGIGAVYSAEA